MATAENVQAWSKTKASNDGADSAIGESSNDQNPNTLDDQVRSLMASVKKLIEDMCGGIAASGTDDLTLSTNQDLSAGHITDGLMLMFRAVDTNTGAMTLDVDTHGAVAIVDQKGNALAAGAIQDNALVTVAYSSHTSKWILVSPPGLLPVTLGGTGASTAAAARTALGAASSAAAARFHAHKNGTDQTISGTSNPTKVTFPTEDFDIDGLFASSAWTPPAGPVLLAARLGLNNVSSASRDTINIYKDGVALVTEERRLPSSSSYGLSITAIDIADGANVYEIYVSSSDSTSYTVRGLSTWTTFSGIAL